MKRIALLSFGLFLLVANTAEARRYRREQRNVHAGAVLYATSAAPPHRLDSQPGGFRRRSRAGGVQRDSGPLGAGRPGQLQHRTAQGVANIMAANNQVGHWGGNPGYEGCGCGATPQAALTTFAAMAIAEWQRSMWVTPAARAECGSAAGDIAKQAFPRIRNPARAKSVGRLGEPSLPSGPRMDAGASFFSACAFRSHTADTTTRLPKSRRAPSVVKILSKSGWIR